MGPQRPSVEALGQLEGVSVAILFNEYDLLAKSGFFDPDFYLSANPDIAALHVDPLMHYLESGCQERRDPSPQFDTSHYISQCEAIGELPANPLSHYLTVGIKRGLTPRPNGKANTRRRAPSKNRLAVEPVTEEAAAKPAAAPKPVGVPSPEYGSALRPPIEPAPAAAVETTLPESPFPGYIDSFGYSSAAGGWFFNGWIPRPFRTDLTDPVEMVAHHEGTGSAGQAILAFYEREDLDQKSVGVIAFVLTSTRVVGGLLSISFEFDGCRYQALAGPSTERLIDQALVDRVRSNLMGQAFTSPNRTQLLVLTGRKGYSGYDTLNSLSEPVSLEIDEAIACPPEGVLLKGWHLVTPGVVRRIRVRSGALAGDLNLHTAITVARPDVISAVGQPLGFVDPNVGFIAYVPGAISFGDACYIEIELENGEVGFKPLKISRRSGTDAIRRTLEGLDIRFGRTAPTFDDVLGPAIHSLNVARLSEPVTTTTVDFGTPRKNPICSLIIPLYGRIDFLEYQMALFSRDPDTVHSEIIYVLDDPPKRRELEELSQSVFQRFRIPFRLMFLSRNLGFAPANNRGLQIARGRYVCFLNSDAFPITDGWPLRLARRLVENPKIGVIGAQLLFEDGSIQHEGCFYREVAEFANWMFVEHFNKGRRPGDGVGLRYCDAITGACMLMERTLALDESYIIGDFEDSDLCLRLRRRGRTCAVDQEVRLYHLERKSQAAPGQSWRMNLTLYNAWVHERRWAETLRNLEASPDTP
jgi:GT2 family glycosyltransferase